MITIYGELYSSKNSKRIFINNGKTVVLPSEAYCKHMVGIEKQLALLLCSWTREKGSNPYPLKVKFKIYRRTHCRFDYINVLQGIQDLMVKYGWLPDDNADILIPVFEPYEVDAKNPRVEISVISELRCANEKSVLNKNRRK